MTPSSCVDQDYGGPVASRMTPARHMDSRDKNKTRPVISKVSPKKQQGQRYSVASMTPARQEDQRCDIARTPARQVDQCYGVVSMTPARQEDQLAGLFLEQLAVDGVANFEVSDLDTNALVVLADTASTTAHNNRMTEGVVFLGKKEKDDFKIISGRDLSRPFGCEFCNRNYENKECLKQHVDSEHIKINPPETEMLLPVKSDAGEEIYSCSHCNYTCNKKQAMLRHHKSHTLPFECRVCGHRSSCMRRMREHVMVHYGQKPFACNLCNYSTARKEHLRLHFLTHTQQKPFACDFCDFKCKTKMKLKIHTRAHTGEKPYKCDYCVYRATRKDYLTSHMRQHRVRL